MKAWNQKVHVKVQGCFYNGIILERILNTVFLEKFINLQKLYQLAIFFDNPLII